MSMPAQARPTDALLDALFEFIETARANPSAGLRTGLNDEETCELLKTRTTATRGQSGAQGTGRNGKLRAASGLRDIGRLLVSNAASMVSVANSAATDRRS
jgi:hypothetical protein